MVEKTILERITINNILAFIIIAGYVGTWSFAIVLGMIEVVPEGETRLGVVLDSLESMGSILGTQTIITVLVVQHYFRKHKADEPEAPITP